MNLCISVYPQKNDENMDKIRNYLELAKKYHINEVFTSLHLPEFTMKEQVRFLQIIANAAKENELELTVDIGGPFIQQALEDDSVMNILKEAKIAYLRLDYGYRFEQLKTLYHQLGLKGFVINASMYNKQQVDEHLHFFKSLDSGIQIKACHNFYVREESGLDQTFALSQSALFEAYKIPVYYCVPCFDSPRGPLHLGLPTIETHRHMPFDLVLMDLKHTYHAESLMFSDEWMSESTLKCIENIVINKEIEIPVILKENLTEMEKRIVLNKHIFRYDSNTSFLRSRSSREMAEFASSITPSNTVQRDAGCITIDNERYLRYSGELQVVLKDAPSDERVNVAACLKNPADIQKLEFFRDGYTYLFQVVK